MPYNSKLFFLVGPSGVGKDTLLHRIKHHQYAHNQPLVAHRYITRPIRENDENHVELSRFDFSRRKLAGLFLFDWESHGYQYAIGREVKKWLKAGQHVIVNGSRHFLASDKKKPSALVPVWITVSEDILRERLVKRGRESEEQIELRLERNRELEKLRPKNCVLIDNNQSIEACVGQIIALVEMNNI